MIWVILLCYPALLLTVNGAMGVLYFLLLLASLFYLYGIRKSHSTAHWDSVSIPFALAMASPILSIFLSQAYHHNFKAASYDWASRFLLCIPIFLALRKANLHTIHILQFGLPIGTLVGLLMLLIYPYDWGGGYHTTSHAFNLIHFSDTALILGFLSLFSINWERKEHPLVLALKLSGFISGCYISMQSGERGGWVAIPLLILLWIVTFNRKNLWLKFSIAIPLLIASIYLSYLLSHNVHTRVDLIFSDIYNYSHGNKDTSVGLRFQLYLAAMHLFMQHPFFGVGPGEFAHSMPALTASGLLTPLGGAAGLSEVHNEILEKCAETGLFGLVAILSVYFVPVLIFWRAAKSTHSSTRIASFMGLCLIFGFFIFGLTVEIFNLKMTAAFFSLTLAVLMAAATHQRTETLALEGDKESPKIGA
jgi:O-antigen ligase